MATATPVTESSLFNTIQQPVAPASPSGPQLLAAAPTKPKPTVKDIASSYSIFQLDTELDVMIDEMQDELETNGQASDASMERFKLFCDAHNDKVDRIARFLKLQESVVIHAKAEAGRFAARAKSGENKAKQIKNMMLWYLTMRDLKKLEGNDFAISKRTNSQDSVKILDEYHVPMSCMTVVAQFNGDLWGEIEKVLPEELRERFTDAVQSTSVSNEAVKSAYKAGAKFEGVSVERGFHLRIS